MDTLTLNIVTSLLAAVTTLTTLYCLVIIRQQQQKIRRLSETDPLTGWLNRRALENTLGREFERCSRVGSRLSVIMFDIDHFKEFHATHGHDNANLALRHITALAEMELRGYDHLFRIGDEKFVVCLPDTDKTEVAKIAERLYRSVQQIPLTIAEKHLQLSISVGCAGLTGADQHFENILKKAERALQAAKQHGHNQVTEYMECVSPILQPH